MWPLYLALNVRGWGGTIHSLKHLGHPESRRIRSWAILLMSPGQIHTEPGSADSALRGRHCPTLYPPLVPLSWNLIPHPCPDHHVSSPQPSAWQSVISFHSISPPQIKLKGASDLVLGICFLPKFLLLFSIWTTTAPQLFYVVSSSVEGRGAMI